MGGTAWLSGRNTDAFFGSPQLVSTYHTRDVRSFDLRFMLMLFTGLLLWGIYGLFIGAASIIVFNFSGCILWMPLAWRKLREGREVGDPKCFQPPWLSAFTGMT